MKKTLNSRKQRRLQIQELSEEITTLTKELQLLVCLDSSDDSTEEN
jgi:hypothetical protein